MGGVDVEKRRAGSGIRKGWVVEGGWRGGREVGGMVNIGKVDMEVTVRVGETGESCG